MYNHISLGGEFRQARICCLLVPTSPPTRENVRQQIRAFLHPIMKAREIIVIGNCAYIPLTQGYFATIDVEDVPLVEGYNWTCVVRPHTVYAYRKDNGRTVNLHRVLMGEPEGLTVDHRDGDGLNNRRSNLRVATKSQNNRNQRMTPRNKSGHKGVSWHKGDQKWRACIHVNNRYVHLGHFAQIDDAVAAYQRASTELHQEFGRLQ